MNQYLNDILWLDGFAVAGLLLGFLIGRYGISGLWTDITNIKNDITNLKLQSPVTVTTTATPTPVKVTPVVTTTQATPTIAHPTSSTSPVLANSVGQALPFAPVVAAV